MSWTKKSADELIKYLEFGLNYNQPLNYIDDVNQIVLTENGDLDEVRMNSEFEEDISQIRRWIYDWKSDDDLNPPLKTTKAELENHMLKFQLIDPEKRTIENILISKKEYTYKSIYEILNCTNFEWVSMGNTDGMYIDGEGMLKNHFAGPEENPQTTWFFKLHLQDLGGSGHHVIAGPALVCGTDEDGDTVSSEFELEYIRNLVEWVPEGVDFTLSHHEG